jgi:hypothetical protein
MTNFYYNVLLLFVVTVADSAIKQHRCFSCECEHLAQKGCVTWAQAEVERRRLIPFLGGRGEAGIRLSLRSLLLVKLVEIE